MKIISQIRPVCFRSSGRKVVSLLSENFDETFLIEGVSFERNYKLAKNKMLLWLLDAFRPLLKRFGEVFIWETNHGIVGSGTIIRVNLSKTNTWILINFALAKHVFGISQVVGMRRLLRVAIRHAAQNGANRIQAYIRSDNYPTLKLCIAEGFQVIDERSYWILDVNCLIDIAHYKDKSAEYSVVRNNGNLFYLPIHILLSYLRGIKRNLFYVYRNNLLLGNIEITTHNLQSTPYRLSIDFFEDLSTDDKKSIIALALSILSNEQSNNLVILSMSSNNGFDTLLSNGRFRPIVKRKLLRLDII